MEKKEEKLVSDAVKHLTEANDKITVLSEEFTHKSDESFKQKEEISHLLAQVGNNAKTVIIPLVSLITTTPIRSVICKPNPSTSVVRTRT